MTAENETGGFQIDAVVGEAFASLINEADLVAAARAALQAEGLQGQAIGLSIEIADDEEVRRLNREYRGADRTTDVLSFANEEAPDWEGRPGVVYSLEKPPADVDEQLPPDDEAEWVEEYDDESDDGPANQKAPQFVLPPELAAQQGEQRYLGDIIISYPQAARQASEFNNIPRREVQELVIHGVFHLLGYDHEETEEREIMRAKEETAARFLGEANHP